MFAVTIVGVIVSCLIIPMKASPGVVLKLCRGTSQCLLQQLRSTYHGQLVAHFHEWNVIAKRSLDDLRLMKVALGIVILSDAIYEDDVYSAFENEIDDLLSDAVGETDATGFTV